MYKMLLLSALVITMCLHIGYSRHISDQLDNEIERSNDIDYGKRITDWVKISQSPPLVLNKPAGSRLELECEAVGSPAPNLQWLKGNTPLTENESFESNLINDRPSRGLAKVRSRLIIHSVLPIHEGTFTCLAESGAKVATTKSKLYVVRNNNSERNFTQMIADEILASRNQPRIVLYDTIYMDNIGSDISLPCKTIGNPRANVVWLDPSDSIVSNDARLSVLPDGELRIRDIRWNDMGPYTCVATNALGQDHVTTFLYPMLAVK